MFDFHIKLCPGACAGTISTSEYTGNIILLEKFLSGKVNQVKKILESKIELASKNEDFESAGNYKRQFQAIKAILTNYRTHSIDALPKISESDSEYQIKELIRILSDSYKTPININRIEAYDVSNISGKDAAVSMVVCEDAIMSRDQYRHFKIKTINTPNDFAMLSEAISRRQNHPEWSFPDLVIIDGGKPQLRAVLKIYKLPSVLVGLAKNPDRLVIITHLDPLITKEVIINPSNPSTKILITLRNEAHRFSRRLHHKQNLKRMFA